MKSKRSWKRMIYRARSRFARKVYKVIHPEFKYVRKNYSGSVGTYAAESYAIKAFNIMQVGPSYNNRIGNKITAKQLAIRLTVSYNTASTADAQLFRVMLFKFKNPEGGGLPGIDYFIDATDSASPYLQAFRNITFIKDIKILKDTGTKMVGEQGGVRPFMVFQWYLKMTSVIQYGGNEGDATDIVSNLYGILLYGDSGENYPQYNLDYTFRYIDC